MTLTLTGLESFAPFCVPACAFLWTALRVNVLKDSSEGFQRGKQIMQALTGKFTSFVARVFGCWHADLSRPFSREGRAYRTCLSCGAQRQFSLRDWEMHGKFFYSN
jgi:hypothetical protein